MPAERFWREAEVMQPPIETSVDSGQLIGDSGATVEAAPKVASSVSATQPAWGPHWPVMWSDSVTSCYRRGVDAAGKPRPLPAL